MVVLEAQPIKRVAQVGALQISKQPGAALLGVGRFNKPAVIVGIHQDIALLLERVCTGVKKAQSENDFLQFLADNLQILVISESFYACKR